MTVTGPGTVSEAAGEAVFRLERTGATTAALTVQVEVTQEGDVLDGAPTDPVDVEFAAGAAAATLTVDIDDDGSYDPDLAGAPAGVGGRITAALRAGTGYTPGTPATHTVDVTDDEDAPLTAALTLEPESPVAESVGTVTVVLTVETARQPLNTYSSTISSRSETARSQDSDFEVLTDTITVAPSEFDLDDTVWRATERFTIGIHDDDVDEEDETFRVTVESSPAPNQLPKPDDLTVTIVDDDTRGMTLSAATLSVDEGASGTYTVVLTTQPTAQVTVTVDGVMDTDLSVVKSKLTFETDNWSTAQTVTVKAGEDMDSEDDEATLTHKAAGGDYTDVAAPTVTVTVVDDDVAGITVEPTKLTIDEGASGTYTVVLTTQPTAQVTVTVDGVMDTDLSVVKSKLTFETDDWSTAQTVTVKAGEDMDSEDDEATLTHKAAGGDYAGVAGPAVTVTVIDDDSSNKATGNVTLDATAPAYGEPVTLKVADVEDADGLNPDPPTYSYAWLRGAKDLRVSIAGADAATYTPGVDDIGQPLSAQVSFTDGAGNAETLASDVTEPVTQAVTVSLAVAPTEINENTQPLTVTVTVTAVTEAAAAPSMSFEVIAANDDDAGTATFGKDYVLYDEFVTFELADFMASAGGTSYEAEKTITFDIVDDDLDEDAEEEFKFRLEGVPGEPDWVMLADAVTVTIYDDDVRGLSLSPEELTVAEGATGTYSVVLTSQPTGTVTVTVSVVEAGTSVSVDPLTLSFDALNWQVPQEVRVTVDQDTNAVTERVMLTFTTAGGGYDGLAAPSLPVTATDDDTQSTPATGTVTIDPTPPAFGAALTATPSGVADADGLPDPITYAYAWLRGEPGAAAAEFVAIGGAETSTYTPVAADVGKSLAARVSFTDAKSNDETLTSEATAPVTQVVTVSLAVAPTRVAEDADDAARIVTATVTAVTETAAAPSAQFIVTAHTNDATAFGGEDYAGVSKTLTFKLADFTASGTAFEAALTHTWAILDDAVDEAAEETFEVLVDEGFPSTQAWVTLPTERVTVTIVDDDTRGVTLSATTLTVTEGETAPYSVVLDSEPTDTVNVVLSGNADVSVFPSIMQFTADNWSVPRGVTVRGALDGLVEPEETHAITHTVTGGDYDGEAVADVDVTVISSDVAGITVNPATLTIDEGEVGTYTVVLDAQPTDSVTVTVGGFTGTDLTVSKEKLTFDTSVWSTAQTVTVTAGEDADAVDDEATLTHTPAGGGYDDVTGPTVVVTVDDADAASTATVTLTGPNQIPESDDEAVFTLTRTGATTAALTVAVRVTQEGDVLDDAGAYAGPVNVTFAIDAAQATLTVGIDDDAAYDPDLPGAAERVGGRVTAALEAGTGYTLGSPSAHAVEVYDGEDAPLTAALTLEPESPVAESVGTVDVVLTVETARQPLRAYAGTISSYGDTASSVEGDFDALNQQTEVGRSDFALVGTVWRATKTFEIVIHDDDLDEEDEAFRVAVGTSPAPSQLPAVDDLPVTIADDDTRGVALSAATLSVDEGGAAGSYTVMLDSQPTDEVTVTVGGFSGTSLTVAKTKLTFTTSDWSTAQTVTVTAGTDGDSDDEAVTLTHAAAGGDYASLAGPSVEVAVNDNVVAGITVDPMALSVDEGDAAGATYTVTLDTEPTAGVTVTVGGFSGTSLTVVKTKLTFTTSNWSTAQTVTVTAGPDGDADDETETLTHAAAGGDYAGLDGPTVAVTVTDDDTANNTPEGPALVGNALQARQAEGHHLVGRSASQGFRTGANAGGYTMTGVEVYFERLPVRAQVILFQEASALGRPTGTPVALTPPAAVGLGFNTYGVPLALTLDPEEQYFISFSPDGDADAGTRLGTTASPAEDAGREAGWSIDDAALGDGAAGKVLVIRIKGGLVAGNKEATGTVSLDDTTPAYGVPLTATVTNAADLDGLTDPAYVYAWLGGASEAALAPIEGADSASYTPGVDDIGQVLQAQVSFDDDDGNPETLTSDATAPVTQRVTVSMEVVPTRIAELGGSAHVTVTTSAETEAAAAPLGTFSVTVRPVDGSAVGGRVSGVDYLPDSRDLEFEPRDFVVDGASYSAPGRTFTVATMNHNAEVEQTETFTVEAARKGAAPPSVELQLPDPVTVTILDYQSRGLTLSAAELTVDEGAAGATYTVALASEPTASAVVTVTGFVDTDLTVTPTMLTFTIENWADEQTLTVTASDDQDAAVDMETLTHTASEGGYYGGVTETLAVTVNDDDVAKITVDPATLSVVEGESGTYTVVLDTQPTANVTVTVGGFTGTDLTVAKTRYTFGTDNWATAQTVTVEAGPDGDTQDDTETLTHTAAGGDYGDVTGPTVAVTVTDRTLPALVLSTATLTVAEGDADGETYTVALNAQPTGNVTVTLSGHSGTDLTVSPETLNFTPTTWQSPLPVKVTARHDDDAGDDIVTLTHAASGADYGDVTGTVAVTVEDDEIAALGLSATQLTVPEGDRATYTVVLKTPPTENVMVTVMGFDETDLTVSPTRMTFKDTNWRTHQTVTIAAGHDDDTQDDAVTLTNVASGAEYADVGATLTVKVADDDEDPPAVTLAGPERVSEADGQVLFTLTRDGFAKKRLPVKVRVTQEGDVLASAGDFLDPVEVTFLAGRHTVTFTVAIDDDAVYDPDLAGAPERVGGRVTATLEPDPGYTLDTPPPSHTVQVTDDDEAPVTLTAALEPSPVPEGAGEMTVTVTSETARQPTIPFVLNVATAPGTASAGEDFTGAESDLTFEPGHYALDGSVWRATRSLKIQILDDDVDEADETFTVVFEDRTTNQALRPVPAVETVTIVDDDTAGIALDPDAFAVAEGGEATYRVALESAPTGPVTIAVTGHAGTDVTVEPESLSFAPSNWRTPQEVKVTAAEDMDTDHEIVTLAHAASGTDSGYAGVEAFLSLTVNDNDVDGLAISRMSLRLAEGDEVGRTYTVALNTEANAHTTVTVSGFDNTDLTVSKTSLTWGERNWTEVYTVTVTAGEDDDAVDDMATLLHTAAGSDYAGQTGSVAVTVVDDDTAGLTLSAASLTVLEEHEAGATYSVALATEPTASVEVTVGGFAGTDLTVAPPKLTFTAADWQTAQTLRVKAAADVDIADDLETLTHTASGADEYAGLAAALPVTVIDDDVAPSAVSFSPAPASVSEVDERAVFTLTRDGSTALSLTVKVRVTEEGDVLENAAAYAEPVDVVFAAAAAETTLTVAIDDDRNYEPDLPNAPAGVVGRVTATLEAATGYTLGDPAAHAIEVTDDDDPPITMTLSFEPESPMPESVGRLSMTVTAETGAGARRPLDDFRVTVSTRGDTANSPQDYDVFTRAVFFPVSAFRLDEEETVWRASKTVSTRIVDDDLDEEDESFGIVMERAPGLPSRITGNFNVKLPIVIEDDDERGVTVSKMELTVAEGGAAGSYDVVLTSQPTETVTVTVTVGDNADATATPDTLEFTADNWSTPQTVTVEAVDDTLVEAEDAEAFTHTVRGGDYAEETAADVQVKVTDNDVGGVDVHPTALRVVEEGAAATYTMVLTAPPGDPVTVTADGFAGTDLTVEKSVLTFTTDTWSTVRTVTVTAGEDMDTDDESATLTHKAAGSGYDDVSVPSVTVATADNDAPALVFTPARLTVTEDDAAGATYTVGLTTQPDSDVTVRVGGFSGTDVNVTPATLTFTTSAWDTALALTVTARADADAGDDSVLLTHAASGGGYAGEMGTVAVTVADVDIPGLTLDPTELAVTENGTATYTAVLETEPTQNVTVTVSGFADTDLTLSATTLNFTRDNWSEAQTLTVSAGDDADSEDDTETLTHMASGAEYGGVGSVLTVRVTDDDEAPQPVTVEGPSLVYENVDVVFTLRRAGLALADLTVKVRVTQEGDVLADPADYADPVDVVFRAGESEATLTVPIDDDDAVDADLAGAAERVGGRVTATLQAGNGYAVGTPSAHAVDVLDDEDSVLTATATVAPSPVPEGGEVTVAVAVATAAGGRQPTARPTLRVAAASGTATAGGDFFHDGQGIAFQPGAFALDTGTGVWSATDSATIHVVQDDVAEGSEDFTISFAWEGPGAARHVAPADATVVIADDDTAGLAVDPTTLTVAEGGPARSYTVALESEPVGTVTVTVTGQTAAVTVSRDTLSFDATNWDAPQAVTVTAEEDADADDADATLTNTPTGGGYDDVAAVTVAVKAEDNEAAGLAISRASLTLDEGDAAGGTYTVALNKSPTAHLTVTVSGFENTDLTVAKTTLTWSDANWEDVYTVTVTALEDDDGLDDMATLSHNSAGPAEYLGKGGAVAVTVLDDDTPDIVLSPTALTLDEDGAGKTWSVVLTTEPSDTTTVTVAGYSETDLTVAKTIATFTATTWATAQTLSVKAKADADATDDIVRLTHTGAGAREYLNIEKVLVVTVVDDDQPPAAVSFSPVPATVSETDGEAVFALARDGTAALSLTVKVRVTQQGDVLANAAGYASPADAVFAAGAAETTLTVAIDDDATLDPDLAGAPERVVGRVTATLEAGTGYTVGDPATYAIEVTDGDSSVTGTLTLDPESPWQESVGTVKVVVTAETAAGGRRPVLHYARTIGTRGATARSPDDYSGLSELVNFRPSDFTLDQTVWRATETLTIDIVDDDVDEADESFRIFEEHAAGPHAQLPLQEQRVWIDDDDTRGVTLSVTELTVAEGGPAVPFEVVLDSEPTDTVTVLVLSVTDVQAEPEELVFTPDNWSEPQATGVQAVDDALVEGTETRSIKLYARGGDYEAFAGGGDQGDVDPAAEVAVTVLDNDVAGMRVEPTALAVTEGDATGATYTVALTAQPSDIVRVTVGGATTDLTVDKTRLTFDFFNWSTAQAVKVTAGEDADSDDETVSLTHTAAGGGYDSVAGPSVAVAVTDNDRPGLSVSTATLAVAEGGSGRYTVALVTQPTATVEVRASGQAGTDLTVSPETLTFTTANWQTAQSVTVAAGEDDDAADDAATLTHTATGADYGGVTATVAVTVDDDEIASLVLSETELTLAEGASGNVHGGAGNAADRRRDGGGDRAGGHGPARGARDPDFRARGLEREAGDGDGRPGRRFARRHGDPDPPGERRGIRRRGRGADGRGDRRRRAEAEAGAEQGGARSGRGRERHLHGGAEHGADRRGDGDGERVRRHGRDGVEDVADVHDVELGGRANHHRHGSRGRRRGRRKGAAGAHGARRRRLRRAGPDRVDPQRTRVRRRGARPGRDPGVAEPGRRRQRHLHGGAELGADRPGDDHGERVRRHGPDGGADRADVQGGGLGGRADVDGQGRRGRRHGGRRRDADAHGRRRLGVRPHRAPRGHGAGRGDRRRRGGAHARGGVHGCPLVREDDRGGRRDGSALQGLRRIHHGRQPVRRPVRHRRNGLRGGTAGVPEQQGGWYSGVPVRALRGPAERCARPSHAACGQRRRIESRPPA